MASSTRVALTLIAANYENCSATTRENRLDDTKALGMVMKQLMEQGNDLMTVPSSKEITLGLENPMDWSMEAVEFLSLTIAAPVSKLSEVSFLLPPPHAAL